MSSENNWWQMLSPPGSPIPASQNHLPPNSPPPVPHFSPQKGRAGADSLRVAINDAFGSVGTRGSSTGNEIPDYTVLIKTPAPDKAEGMPLIENIVGYCNNIEHTVLYETNGDAYDDFAARDRGTRAALRDALIDSGVVVSANELSPERKRRRMTAGFADLAMASF